MKKRFYQTVIVILTIFITTNLAEAQLRVAVLPFQNMDGKMEYNAWCYRLQDSVSKMFVELQQENSTFVVIQPDELEEALAEYNLDPQSPEYESDLWKAISDLSIDRVISGDFVFTSNRFVVNAYIYDVELKLPDPDNQVHNLAKPEARLYEVVPVIVRKLKNALIAN